MEENGKQSKQRKASFKNEEMERNVMREKRKIQAA